MPRLTKWRKTHDARDSSAENPDRLTGNRAFMLLWTGSTISTLGSRITAFAWPVAIVYVTGSAVAGGVVLSSQMAGSVLATVFAGVIADVVDRRTVLVVSTSTQGLLLLLTAGMFAAHVHAWAMYAAVAFLIGVCGSPVGPAAHSALRDVVARPLIAKAKAVLEVRSHVANLVGPALGALLLSAGGWLPFAADGASYLAWAAAARSVDLPPGAKSPESAGQRLRSLCRSLLSGWQKLFGDVALRALVKYAALTNFAVTLATSTVILQLSAADEAVAKISLIPTTAAVLGIIGGLGTQRLLGRLSLGHVVVVNATIMVAAAPVLVIGTHVIPLALALGAVVALEPAINAGTFAHQSAVIEDAFQGRVFSAMRLAVMGPVIVGALCSGVVAELPNAASRVVTGGILMASALLVIVDRRIRTVPRMV